MNPLTFRPTARVTEILRDADNKTAAINRAIEQADVLIVLERIERRLDKIEIVLRKMLKRRMR